MEAMEIPNTAKLSQTTFSEADNYKQISSMEREDGQKLIDLVGVAIKREQGAGHWVSS